MYENYDRLTSVIYNGAEKFIYSYNVEGLISRHEDKVNNKTYQYTYDLIGRPVRVESSDGSYIESGYDQMNLATRSNYRLGNESKNVAYTYSDRDNLPESVSFDGKIVTNIYDDLTRLTSKAYSLGNTSGSVSYTYLDHETDANRTTGVVGSISYFGENTDLSLGTRYYDYDNQGNVIREYRYSKDELGLRESYEYDAKNQLIRHNSKTQNKTFIYSYDNAGNILSKNEYAYTISETLGTPVDTTIYLYESTDGWGDKLTSYDGKAITYDAIGNMISFDGKTYSWQRRELTQITSATDMYSYKYDAEGIRTEKTVNGVKTEYFLNGSQILAETTDGNTMWFIYDSQGSRVALVQNGQVFYYMYNLQGDVIGLIDETTGNVAATYDYDAWGRCTLIENAEGYTVGTDNPFRYRGYYYDEETGLYLTGTRYYDSEIGRFISADSYISTGQGVLGNNMYTYCLNNPVNMFDPTGEFAFFAALGGAAIWKLGIAIVGIIGTVVIADTLAKNPLTFPSISISNATAPARSDSKDSKTTLSCEKPPAKDPVHHIVAKADLRATESRQILREVGIEPVTDSRNLVVLPQNYHASLHTTSYHNYVTASLRTVRGNRIGVEMTLDSLKAEILMRSAIGIRWD